jgi:DNA-binding XRE family transcriptional regulator
LPTYNSSLEEAYVPTLHLLPGESRGDTADIVLNKIALDMLKELIAEVEDHGHSCKRFRQRDGTEYTLCMEVIDKEDSHEQWRMTRLAYMRHDQRRRIAPMPGSRNGCRVDCDLLSAHLYAARKTHHHTQTDAALAIGVSVGFISDIENCHHVPRERNFEKLCNYIGTAVKEYVVE